MGRGCARDWGLLLALCALTACEEKPPEPEPGEVRAPPAATRVELKSQEARRVLVAGHAYGAHDGTNPGLLPAVARLMGDEKVSGGAQWVLTGDFLRKCNPRSWALLERQLAQPELPPLLARGSHEVSKYCFSQIVRRQGASHFHFPLGKARGVILDTENPERRVPPEQIATLRAALKAAGGAPVLVFTHYLIWATDEGRYRAVPGNHGSRGERIAQANYLKDVHPLLKDYTGQVIVFAGDTGGRPDAKPHYRDERDGVTLIASGMGETPDPHVVEVVLGPAPLTVSVVPLEAPDERRKLFELPKPDSE